MPPTPIRISSPEIDLSGRFQRYGTVDASPATNAETVVATLTLADFGNLSVVSGIMLRGWLAFTVGTSGTAATLKLHQTNAAGTLIKSSGATTVTAANLLEMSIQGFDAAPGIGAYALTLQITGGAAASTVSAVELTAFII